MTGHALVIFTDLDGTLLDRATYSYERATLGIGALKKRGIPLVFCSSRTRTEQEALRKELAITAPFIVEDGSALIVPEDYFPFDYDYSRRVNGCHVIEYGLLYDEVRKALPSVEAEAGAELTGYGDLSVEELSRLSGLGPEEAARAKAREYQETIVSGITPENMNVIRDALRRRGLTMTHGGRFYGVGSSRGKGQAARALIDLIRRREPDTRTAGIGDSQNDASLLEVVDMPFLVQKPGGVWEDMTVPNVVRVPEIGPEGWLQAISQLLR